MSWLKMEMSKKSWWIKLQRFGAFQFDFAGKIRLAITPQPVARITNDFFRANMGYKLLYAWMSIWNYWNLLKDGLGWMVD